MKIWPLLSLVCLFTFSTASTLNAQKFNVNWGDDTKLNFEYEDAVPLANGGYMLLQEETKKGIVFGSRKMSPNVILVDAKMNNINERKIELEGKAWELIGLKRYGRNVFFLYSYYDRSEKTTSVYAIRINDKTLAPSPAITLGVFESDKESDQAESTYKLSADSSKILIFTEGPERKKDNKKFYIGVFDTELKTIWKKEVELPFGDRYISIYDQDVLNDSKVVVAIKHYDKEVTRQMVREDGDKVPSYTYKLMLYNDAKSPAKELQVNLDNFFVGGTKLVYNTNGTVTAAGLYKRKHNGHINGVFYGNLDVNSFVMEKPKMVPFTNELLTLVDKDDYAKDKGNDPGLYANFRVKHVLARTNGSVDVISEYSKTVVSTSVSSNGTTTTRYYYYSGDIIVTNIDKTGNAVFTRIPKDHIFVDLNMGLGYFPYIYGDKLILMYNDKDENLERDLAKAPEQLRRLKRVVFAAAVIDAKGNFTRQPVYSYRDEDYLALPTEMVKVANNKMLLTANLFKLFRRRTRFGIVEIK